MDSAEKQEQIGYLTQRLMGAPVAFCADYRGLTVLEFSKLRKELRGVGSIGKVVKNTLARRAAGSVFATSDRVELEKFIGTFEGPSLMVFASSDPVSPAKIISKFQKDHKAFNVKGAFFEGSFLDNAGVDALSKLPNKEEVLAKLLNLMTIPATQIVRLLQAPGQQLVQVLEAHRKNLEEKA